jgi:hypothetical protein
MPDVKTIPPQDGEILRALRKIGRSIQELNIVAEQEHGEVLRAISELGMKVDACIDDVRGYRDEQRKLEKRIEEVRGPLVELGLVKE